MGFSEEKNQLLQHLLHRKKANDRELASISKKKDGEQVILATKTSIYEADKADLANAEANRKSSALALKSAVKLERDIKESIDNSEVLLRKTVQMMKDAHKAARKTTEFALSIQEFNKHLTTQSKHNKVILNLLINESSQALIDAKKAVTTTSKALVDSITAIKDVIHLKHSLSKTSELLGEALPLFTSENNKTRKKGLDDILDAVHVEAHTYLERSHHDLVKAEEEFKILTEKFVEAQIASEVSSGAYSATVQALKQSAN